LGHYSKILLSTLVPKNQCLQGSTLILIQEQPGHGFQKYSLRSIHCKLKMITGTDKAARSTNEILGSIKNCQTLRAMKSRSRKVSLYAMQWTNWAWNIVFGFTYHILRRMCVALWYILTQRIQFILLMSVEYRVHGLVKVVFLYLVAWAAFRTLEMADSTLCMQALFELHCREVPHFKKE
jgi:hypothetical protein